MQRMQMTLAILIATGILATASAQTTHNVDVGPGFTFTPTDIVIEVGDTVRWTWVSGFHNVESGLSGTHDGIFRSGDPTSVVGTEYEVTFDEAFVAANPVLDNAYNYYCAVHAGLGMVGSVQVITCPSDLDGDGEVALSDLQLLLSSYGSTEGVGYYDGDFDYSGSVDLADLQILLSRYGTSCN